MRWIGVKRRTLPPRCNVRIALHDSRNGDPMSKIRVLAFMHLLSKARGLLSVRHAPTSPPAPPDLPVLQLG